VPRLPHVVGCDLALSFSSTRSQSPALSARGRWSFAISPGICPVGGAAGGVRFLSWSWSESETLPSVVRQNQCCERSKSVGRSLDRGTARGAKFLSDAIRVLPPHSCRTMACLHSSKSNCFNMLSGALGRMKRELVHRYRRLRATEWCALASSNRPPWAAARGIVRLYASSETWSSLMRGCSAMDCAR
jgi:hypothetical protein